MGVRGRKALCRLSHSLKCSLVFYGRCIITLPQVVWTLRVGNIFLDITLILLYVVFLALYIAFFSSDHFYQLKFLFWGERLVEVSLIESILEHPHKHLLFWWDGHDGGFIKVGEVVPQWLWQTMLYVDLSGGGHLLVTDGGELEYKFLYKLLIVGDGGTYVQS